jgi:PIN domain nuclease of toxin-antitoxin system
MLDLPEKLPAKVRKALRQETSPFGVSTITLWEISKLTEKRKINLASPVEEWLHNALNSGVVCKIHLDEKVAVESTRLPEGFHRDPSDQIIVATARVHNLTLVTADQKILAYRHVKTLWD